MSPSTEHWVSLVKRFPKPALPHKKECYQPSDNVSYSSALNGLTKQIPIQLANNPNCGTQKSLKHQLRMTDSDTNITVPLQSNDLLFNTPWPCWTKPYAINHTCNQTGKKKEQISWEWQMTHTTALFTLPADHYQTQPMTPDHEAPLLHFKR